MMTSERGKWLKTLDEPVKAREWHKMSGQYHCPELSLPAVRVGADNHAEHPSRRGNTLYYRDGRTERVTQ
jgi:hypothetical protein